MRSARPERPYRGLFASGTAGSAQTLSVSGSAGGGYDDNILLDLPGGGTLDPRLVKSGKVATGDGSMSYAFNGDRVTFGASGGSMVRFYPSNGEDRDDLRTT